MIIMIVFRTKREVKEKKLHDVRHANKFFSGHLFNFFFFLLLKVLMMVSFLYCIGFSLY